MPVLSAVVRAIRRHAMLAGGETVAVAVSGGADSVALLHLLCSLAPAWNLRLHVIHIDHQLREESAREAGFVRDLGRRLGVPVQVVPVSVIPGPSLEAQARTARYAALEAWADTIGADRIAIGHTADDQAETVLMRVLEGTGLRGLAGIPPVRGRLIRPLLDVRRIDLVAELARAGLSWIEDPSNRDPKFLRNRIRHDVLPLIASEYNPAIVEALTRVARAARESVGTVERLAEAELARHAQPAAGAILLPLGRVRALPPAVAAEMLRQAAAVLGTPVPLRAWAHRGLRRLLADPAPRRGFRLGGVTLDVSGAWIRLGTGPIEPLATRVLAIPGRTELAECGLAIDARLMSPTGYALPRDPNRVAFDAGAVPMPLTVRARRPGDYFTAFGGRPRRLKGLLIDAKVPRWQRSRVPLVEGGGHIVWVAGVRRGALAPVTGATGRILELALNFLS